MNPQRFPVSEGADHLEPEFSVVNWPADGAPS
jgi:hypothetical protein